MAGFCRYCGSGIEENARFCPQCGRDLAVKAAAPAQAPEAPKDAAGRSEAPLCPGCGKPLSPTAVFCRYCGTQITRAAQGAAPARAEAPAAPAPGRTARAPAQESSGSAKPEKPAVQPGAAQPKAAPAGSGGKPGKKKLIPAVAGILVIVLLFTGFVQPGFFRAKGKPGSTVVIEARPSSTPGGSGGQSGGSSGGSSGSQQGNSGGSGTAGAESAPAPFSPADVDLGYTEREIAEAPAASMTLSEGETRASAGDFSVDFGEFNPIGEDTFTVRTLPVHTDEAKGYYLRGYDFSLASGRSEFLTEVAVTIPRDPGDGELVTFLTRDPVTGKNREEYFEISEDGASYILYTTHFSEHDLVVQSSFGAGDGFADDVRRADVSSASTRAALSAFYYTSWTQWYDRMTTPVGYSPYDLWRKVTNNFTSYLPSGYALMAAVDERIKKAPKNELPKNVDICGALLFNEAELKDQVKDMADTADLINNSKTAVVDTGVGYLDKLALENISPGLKNVVHEQAAYNAEHPGGNPFFIRLGAITTCLGFYLTNEKVEREIAAGKFDTATEAVWDHVLDYAGTAAGFAGLVGGAMAYGALGAGAVAAGPAVALGAAIVGLGLFAYSKLQGTPPYSDLTGAERNYREYYLNGGSPRRFYYDEPSRAGCSYGAGATGSISRLTALNDKESEAFKKLINEEYSKYNYFGGISAEDPRDKKANSEWSAVFIALREVLKDKPELLSSAVLEFYQNYANACWDLGDAAFLSYSREAMDARGEAGMTAVLPPEKITVTEKGRESDKGKASKEEYTARLVKELFAEHRPLLESVARQFEHEALLAMNDMIRTELLPLLNTPMEFTVEDLSLSDPKNFSHSVYNHGYELTGVYQDFKAPDGSVFGDIRYAKDYPMTFCIKKEDSYFVELDGPVFMPATNFSKDVRDFGTIVVGLSLSNGQYVDYFPNYDNFIPMLRDEKDGNVVFRCTYFNYLMMGAPTAVAFRDLTDYEKRKNDIEDEIVEFEIPKPGADGVIRINLQIGEPKDLESDDPEIFNDSWAIDARAYGYEEGMLKIELNEPDELWPWKAAVYVTLIPHSSDQSTYDKMCCYYNQCFYDAKAGVFTVSEPDVDKYYERLESLWKHTYGIDDPRSEPGFRNSIAVPETMTFRFTNNDLYQSSNGKLYIDRLIMTLGDKKYYCYGEWETDDWMEKPPSVPN